MQLYSLYKGNIPKLILISIHIKTHFNNHIKAKNENTISRKILFLFSNSLKPIYRHSIYIFQSNEIVGQL